MADYIDGFYNRTRRHSHLGGVSPEQFERLTSRGEKVSTESWELHAGVAAENLWVGVDRAAGQYEIEYASGTGSLRWTTAVKGPQLGTRYM